MCKGGGATVVTVEAWCCGGSAWELKVGGGGSSWRSSGRRKVVFLSEISLGRGGFVLYSEI